MTEHEKRIREALEATVFLTAVVGKADLRALLADLDAVRAEAVRYRKLRQQHEEADSGLTLCVFQPVNDSTLEPVGSMPGELDAAIDALKGATA